MTALLAGNADIAVLPAAAVMPQVKAGKIKALAVATGKRSGVVARAADARRERPQGHPGRRLDGLRRAGEDTGRRSCERLHDELVQILADAGGAREAQAAVHGRRRRLAGRGARGARRRHRAMAADHPEEQHHPGLIGADDVAAIAEPARSTPVFGEFDVVVLGGGPAGLARPTRRAARRGATTLLVERYGFLGGMGTAAGVTNFCGLLANVHGANIQVVHGVADELLERCARSTA